MSTIANWRYQMAQLKIDQPSCALVLKNTVHIQTPIKINGINFMAICMRTV
ncbi:MAG: hypothetical protein WDZ41_03375 [Candidatus Babeliales bacterium]